MSLIRKHGAVLQAWACLALAMFNLSNTLGYSNGTDNQLIRFQVIIYPRLGHCVCVLCFLLRTIEISVTLYSHPLATLALPTTPCTCFSDVAGHTTYTV